MKANSRATALAFLVISTQSNFATCTGTREQLINAGLVCADEFPEGRCRKRYAANYNLSRAKGGLFKWESAFQKRQERIIREFRIFPSPETDGYRTQWRGPELDKAKLDRIVGDIHSLFVEAQEHSIRRKITLVKPGQTMDSFASALPEERGGTQ